MRVLLIEDDAVLGDAIRDHVAANGHAVDWARRVGDARDHLQAVAYGLALLDLRLPDGSGLDLLRALRRAGDRTPIIILTARDQLSDRVEGLDSGADDYLVKPFALAELTARMAAVGRRFAGNPNPLRKIGRIEVDLAQRKLLVDGTPTDLSAREWALMDLLAARPGATVSKSQLEDALYAFGAEVESNTVEVYVSRLRKKIGRDAVRTLRGIGYRITER